MHLSHQISASSSHLQTSRVTTAGNCIAKGRGKRKEGGRRGRTKEGERAGEESLALGVRLFSRDPNSFLKGSRTMSKSTSQLHDLEATEKCPGDILV